MNFSRHFYAITGIIVILSALSLGAGGKRAATRSQPMQVNVVNSTTSPVNTKAIGTTAVSGTVGVSGTVAVSGSVNVGNTQPIAVKNDDSDREPVNVSALMSQGSGTAGSNQVVYTVPAGKMLVLQAESFQGQVQAGQQISIGRLDLNPFGLVALNYDEKGSIGSSEWFGGVSSATYYLSAGTIVSLAVSRSASDGNAEYRISLSGYLVPMPVAAP